MLNIVAKFLVGEWQKNFILVHFECQVFARVLDASEMKFDTL